MDRFLMRISVGYPDHDEEKEIVRSRRSVTEAIRLNSVATVDDILAIQRALPSVRMEDVLLDYIVHIVEDTRNAEGVLMGVSPRGSIALAQAASARAILQGRDYVLPEDIKEMAACVLAHRIVLRNRSGAKGTTAQDVINKILQEERAPKVK